MKLDGHDHPKVLDFAARLKVSRPTAIGHLELLWGMTAKLAPQGNIGKWPDGAIARACDWMDDPEPFVEALTDAGLLVRSSEHRLVVHDWKDHAPGWVRAKLAKLRLAFISTDEATSEPSSEASSEPSSRARAFPSLAKPREGEEQDPPPHKNGSGKPKTPIGDLSLSDAMRQKALERFPDCDPERMFEQFRAHHEKLDSRFASWSAAWTTWIGNGEKFGYPKRGAGGIRWA